MKNKILSIVLTTAMMASMIAGCGSSAQHGATATTVAPTEAAGAATIAAANEAAGAATTGGSSDGKTIKIGVVSSLTGGSAIYGEGAQNAITMAAEESGQPYACEVFADRAYLPDGTLVPRSKPDAMITDEKEAIDRVVRMIKEHRVRAVNGDDIDIKADTVCVHGDGEKALEMVKTIRKRMMDERIELKAF